MVTVCKQDDNTHTDARFINTSVYIYAHGGASIETRIIKYAKGSNICACAINANKMCYARASYNKPPSFDSRTSGVH